MSLRLTTVHENARCALEFGSLLPLFAGRLAGGATVSKWREQARSQKAAASCRTPKRLRRSHFHGSSIFHSFGYMRMGWQ